MSTNEMIRKLNNARRDFLGRKTDKGDWFRPPNPTAKDRVLRWAWRLRRNRVINEEIHNQLLAEVGEPATCNLQPATNGVAA